MKLRFYAAEPAGATDYGSGGTTPRISPQSNGEIYRGGHDGNKKSSESGRFGIDNLTYDLIAAIHEKAQGLEAFEQYLQDAQSASEARQCFEELQRQDRESVQRLQRILAKRLSQNQGQRAA